MIPYFVQIGYKFETVKEQQQQQTQLSPTKMYAPLPPILLG